MNTKALRSNRGSGGRAALKRFYVDKQKFIMRNGKHFTVGTWIRAVQEGQSAPKAAEALQMPKEIIRDERQVHARADGCI
eukprot:9199882-Karenia_brevis.AAC.1